MCRGFEPQSPHELVHVPQSVDAGDRLLAEIATLHEVDRPIVAANLLGQVPLRHIAAEDRSAGLDPQNLKGVVVELGQAQPRPQGPERAGSPPGAVALDERESGPPVGDSRTTSRGQFATVVARWANSTGAGTSPPASFTNSSARGPARWNSKVDWTVIQAMSSMRRTSGSGAGQHRAPRIGARRNGVRAREDLHVRQRLPLGAGDRRLASVSHSRPASRRCCPVVPELGPVGAGRLEPHPARPSSSSRSHQQLGSL